MQKIKSFNFTTSAFQKSDYSALNEFQLTEVGADKMFLNGRLYNISAAELLNSYQVEGIRALKKVDGDFTLFVISSQKIVIVRDRHGVGAQVFYNRDFITSNLSDFTKLENFECKPNIEALFTFMSIGYIPAPMSSLEGVKKLPAGHCLTIENGQTTVTDLFPSTEYFARNNTCKLALDEAVVEYERLHKKAISQRIENASKVGLLLSGGYDSGGNISALRDVYDDSITSYSIGFKNNQWTELPLAKLLSEKYGSKHYEYEIDGSEIMNLPQILSVTGDPFQEGGLLVNYTAMELVRQSGEEPDVILGGDGNDQHFGTSGKELALHWKMKQKRLQPFQKMFDYVGNLGVFNKDNILFRTEFHNRKILYIQQSDIFGFTPYEINKLNSTGLKIDGFEYLKSHPEKFENFDAFFFNRNLNIDIKQVINEVILYKSSRMAELFDNCMTFPYMSTDLYEFLSTLPVDYKCHGTFDKLSSGQGVSKYLHKEYLKSKLPTEITDRKKQGGFAPLPIFLRDDKQRKMLFSYLRKSDMVKLLFKAHGIDKLLNHYENSLKSKPYWFWFQQVKSNQIINLLTVAVWWDMVINKKNISSMNELV
ncbi:MAG: asparagine synthase-related protein [Paludibacter sp.]|nr:asparagine synthase-related protein [Paludibacter sp.]